MLPQASRFLRLRTSPQLDSAFSWERDSPLCQAMVRSPRRQPSALEDLLSSQAHPRLRFTGPNRPKATQLSPARATLLSEGEAHCALLLEEPRLVWAALGCASTEEPRVGLPRLSVNPVA